jgi:hypothetical protein
VRAVMRPIYIEMGIVPRPIAPIVEEGAGAE